MVQPTGKTGSGIPQNFVGFSWETWSVPLMTGKPGQDPSPVKQLVANLSSGGPINLRIGGNSQDVSWWLPNPSKVPSSFLTDGYVKAELVANRFPEAKGSMYFITPNWIGRLASFLQQSGMETIFGLNLSLGNTANTQQLVNAIIRQVDRQNLQAFEIGNEPNLYGRNQRSGWHKEKGKWVKNKDIRKYLTSNLVADYGRYIKAMPVLIKNKMIAGPAFADPSTDWTSISSSFYNKFRSNLGLATQHLYAMKPKNIEGTRTIPKLMSDPYSINLGARLGKEPSRAHQAGLRFRLDEFNTACIGGEKGVSDRFAAAIWAPSALRSVAKAGVDGVNVHFGYGTAYKPFWVDWKGKQGLARVAPLYYGLYFFSQTTGNGSKDLPLSITNPQSGVDVWLTQAWNSEKKLAMVNRSSKPAQVKLALPDHPAGNVYRLLAPSPSSESGVSWAGRTFDQTGKLSGSPIGETVVPQSGIYTVDLPAYSAALLRVPTY